MALPKVPTVFFKPDACLNSATAPIVVPHVVADDELDYEAELAVVIAKDCKNVSVEDSMQYVLGYMISNDVSARKHQFAAAQWTYGKGFDTFAPVGPTLVSSRAIPDPSKLFLKTTLNDKLMQDGKTENLIFTVPELVSFLSQGTTLRAGNVIMTGTPHGVGTSQKPPVCIRIGDSLRVWGSNGLGTLVNPVIRAEV